MHLEPLATATLAATQQVAAALFPWEQEHTEALAASLAPDAHAAFFATRRLASVRCWTAHLGASPVLGLATLYGYRAQPDELWLAWFGLVPAARGQRGGAKLLDWLIAHARAEGRRTLRLWTTDEPEYDAALRLYASRGFTAEDHPALPGETWRTLVLSRSLHHIPAIPWSAVLDRSELCGRLAPFAPAAAA